MIAGTFTTTSLPTTVSSYNNSCQGALQNIETDFETITSSTVIATNSPYRNNQSWTRHARCAANETMWYRFKFFCLETGYDYATVTFSNTSEASLCLTGNQQMQQWRRSNSELLTISFSSDGFVTSGGFELIVACRASGNNDWLDIIEEEDNQNCEIAASASPSPSALASPWPSSWPATSPTPSANPGYNCPGALQNQETDFDNITSSTIIATTSPYSNSETWTRHARCAPNQTLWYRFSFFCLETNYDYATLIFSNESEINNQTIESSHNQSTLCLTGSLQMQDWRRSNSELLVVSFKSDNFINNGGFELITQCTYTDEKLLEIRHWFDNLKFARTTKDYVSHYSFLISVFAS